ncbi:MAG: TIGR01459 family HAD-type hydrolase, partial [Paracoccaceae bacterium]|nr:TIGR01459 family HAD-type hydrolase [Paracoccaceae bacterium]
MAQIIEKISKIAKKYDAIVFDQWGVLHDGSSPYPGVIDCLVDLASYGLRLAVLSNSGKRSKPNEKRITSMGFPISLFEIVMTSGEALWRDVANGIINETHFFPIEHNTGDAIAWANDLSVTFKNSVSSAQAILLMGISDGHSLQDCQDILDQALALEMPVYCSNPDLLSPRSGGKLVTSAGALASYYRKRGGKVVFYGKPHEKIFASLQNMLRVKRLLMVGDSLDHDIMGGHAVAWDTLLIQGEIHASELAHGNQAIILS